MKPDPAVDVSIIIVNWHNTAFIQQTIDSFTTVPPGISWEMIIWDNGKENHAELTWGISVPVKWVQSLENTGFGAGVNAASDLARGECLFILNPDVFLLPGTLESLVHTLMLHPETGVIVPILVDQHHDPVSSIRPFPSFLTVFMESSLFCSFKFVHDRMSRWKYREQIGTGLKTIHDQPMGAAMMIRREVFTELHGFDEDFFLFFEDVDFFYRIKMMGKSAVMDTDAMAVHEGGASIKRAHGADRHFYRGFILFFNKHRGLMAAIAARAILCAAGTLAFGIGLIRMLRGNRDGSIPTGVNMWKAALGAPAPKPDQHF